MKRYWKNKNEHSDNERQNTHAAFAFTQASGGRLQEKGFISWQKITHTP
jgi:hypothetical protein